MPRKRTRAERVIAFLEEMVLVPEGALVGQPLKLAPFQKRFIREVYDNPAGTRTAVLSVGRKNAKTATLAGLALAHTVGPEAVPNSEIISGARSREQAALVFRYASKMIQMSPKLRDLARIIPSGKRIVGLRHNVEYHAISAEAGTAHGLSPVVAIIDEPGQVRGPQDDFIDAVVTSQGAYREPLLIYIGTQAATDADLFSILIDDALRSQDPRIVCHLYAADEDCDILSRKAWKASNPAIGLFRSEDDVKQLAEEAQRMPSRENTFRNLILNQRVSVVAPFVSRSVWELNGQPPEPLREGVPTYAGLDLSARTDLTALVVSQLIDGIWHDHSFHWTPSDGLAERARRDRSPYVEWVRDGYLLTTPGKTVDYEFVAREMGEIFDGLEVHGVAFDRYRIDVLKKELDDLGIELPLVEFGQGYKSMSPALEALEADLLNARRRHGMHPVLTMCAANAVVTRDPTGARKLDKSKATGRIDGMVALAMSRGCVDKAEELAGPSVYEARGILVI